MIGLIKSRNAQKQITFLILLACLEDTKIAEPPYGRVWKIDFTVFHCIYAKSEMAVREGKYF